LAKHETAISMTGKNHCFDNAVAERVNGILKHEFGLDKKQGKGISAIRKMFAFYCLDKNKAHSYAILERKIR
jgi:transposase InsO family protein